MSHMSEGSAPVRGYWVIGALALVWNLVGVGTYLMSVTMSEEALAALPEAQRALQSSIPAWVTSAYAIAVFGGTLASVGLLLRKVWAVPVFVVSLLAILVQMGHAFFMTEMLAVMGASSAVLPLFIILVAVYLVWFAGAARQKGWLR